MRGSLRHPPATTTRTETPALAGEGDETILAARGAPESSKAAGQTPAVQELAKLQLDERRQAFAIAHRRGVRPERFEVVPHARVEHCRLRVARFVDARRASHENPETRL